MKNLLLALLFLLPLTTLADAWDNLTRAEAEKVVEYLEENPFIYDYCDCCGSEERFDATLLKVLSTKIVTCDWDENFYSVKVEVKPIAEITNKGTVLNVNNPIVPYDSSEEGGGGKTMYDDGYTIYMNYTWGHIAGSENAGPIYLSVPYDYYGENELSKGQCKPLVEFPNPKLKSVKSVFKDKQYSKWYKKRK